MSDMPEKRDETCGSCGQGSYSEGGDNGTVACGRDCTIRDKQAKACDYWTLFKSGPKEVAPSHG